jgi:hypothetical protein
VQAEIQEDTVPWKTEEAVVNHEARYESFISRAGAKNGAVEQSALRNNVEKYISSVCF